MKSNFTIKALVFSLATLVAAQVLANEDAVAAVTTKAPRFSTKVIDRGITPTGIVNVKLNSQVNNLKTVGLNVGSDFGIVKNLEGKFSYDGVEFNKWNATNTFNLGAQYKYFGMSNMSNSLSLNLPIHVGRNAEIVQSLTVGLPTVFFNNVMAFGILGDALTWTMRPDIKLAFDLKWWYGYQVYGDFWAQLSSSFGTFGMDNNKGQGTWSGEGFWKKLPLSLDMTYALNHYFDVGANVGFNDVFKSDSFTFGLNLAMRAGKLFG